MIQEAALKNQIDSYYDSITEKSTAREKAEKCYAIIGIKGKSTSLERYRQPLYLDVKQFVTQHLNSFEDEMTGNCFRDMKSFPCSLLLKPHPLECHCF